MAPPRTKKRDSRRDQAAAKCPQKPAVPATRPKNTLVSRLKPGETPVAAEARLAVAGLTSNAMAVRVWSAATFGEVDITECLNAVVESARRINGGDLGDAEALLTAQAVSLNAIFANLAQRAYETKYLEHFEKYLRLALKAQGQSRATCETLAVLKNPPVFARQANIANGPQQVNNAQGPQQVNNQPGQLTAEADARARGNCEDGQIKLLEAHSERLDTGTAGTPGSSHLALAPVGTRHRPAHNRGQGAIGAERVPGRPAAGGSPSHQGAQRCDPGAGQ